MPSQSARAPHTSSPEVDNIVAPRLELHVRRGCHGKSHMSILKDRQGLPDCAVYADACCPASEEQGGTTEYAMKQVRTFNGSVRPIPRHVTPGTLVKWSSCCGELVLKTVMPQISSVQRMLIFRLQSFSASGHRADDKVSELG